VSALIEVPTQTYLSEFFDNGALSQGHTASFTTKYQKLINFVLIVLIG